MSPTTEDLRARIAVELDDLGNLPDLVPAAARAGARKVRRRRLAAGSALGVVAVGGGVLSTMGGSDGAGRLATSQPTSPSPSDPLADGRVTTDEWHETVRDTLESLLPERYGAVSTAPAERDRAQAFHTSGGDPRLQISVGVSGRDASGKSDPTCASQSVRDIRSCKEAHLPDGWFAVATTEVAPPTGDGAPAAHGTSLLFLNEGVFVELSASELGWDGLEPNGPANLGAQELVDLASTPEFLEMVRVGVEWDIDQPAEPDEITMDTDPVWPTAP